jgi:heat shock protein HslJ
MLSGCGGAPVSLLTGGEWLVEDVAGGGVIDNAEVTIEFLADGSVFGSGGCNRYSGGFTLTGEGLGFGPAATTMMACPEAASNMEQSFFQTLSTVIRFDISDTGALMLYDAEGAQVIRAFRR